MHDARTSSSAAAPAGATAVRWRPRPKQLLALALLLVAGVVGYQLFWRYHVKRYQVVREGVFYRVAQPTELGLKHLIERDGVQTVICLQLYRPRLKRGMYDPGEPSGLEERHFVQAKGARYLEWPQGQEACWPWPTPWVYEQFFALLDDPSSWPVAVHCMGGRHRTGTLSALFRLEYDRWPVDKALDEMYGFQFGLPISLHEHNLRTYAPRPHPDSAQWQALCGYWQPMLAIEGVQIDDYEQLVRALRARRHDPQIEQSLADYLAADGMFALCLAQRVVDGPEEPLAQVAAERAAACLQRDRATAADWQMAAALVADFGTPDQQAQLLKLLEDEPRDAAPSPRYQAVAVGVTNRYTRNRIPYLRPLLEDARQRPEPHAARYRYCDTAMARLSVIIDTNLMEHGGTPPGMTNWQYACQLARQWMQTHDRQTRLSQLVPAEGDCEVLAGALPSQEDLSRMRK